MAERLPLTRLAHRAVAAHLRPGALVVDATAGNGYDTVFLAERVGPGGHVWAFDVQAAALAATRQRLQACELAERVTLLLQGHERLADVLPPELRGRLDAVMFNLGYRPGGDHGRVTTPQTTLAALEQAATWLAPDGVISLLVYRGHAGGVAEHRAVAAWLHGLPLAVERHDAARGGESAPVLYLLRCRACLGGSASSASAPAH